MMNVPNKLCRLRCCLCKSTVEALSIITAVANAQKAGWFMRRNEWYCPDHAKKTV